MSRLTFSPAFTAVSDGDDAPLRHPHTPRAFCRLTLAIALALAVAFPVHVSAQIQPSPHAQKIYAKLQRFSPQDEIEVKLRTKDRIHARIASFDQTALQLDGRPNPIPLDDIANVRLYEPRGQAPAWNPATGFIRSWKSAAIVGVCLLALSSSSRPIPNKLRRRPDSFPPNAPKST